MTYEYMRGNGTGEATTEVFYTYDEEFLTVRRVIHTRQDIDDFALIDWEEDED